MSVALEGSHICRAVKMALHISENAVLESVFTVQYHHKKIALVERPIIRSSCFPLKTKQTSILSQKVLKIYFIAIISF